MSMTWNTAAIQLASDEMVDGLLDAAEHLERESNALVPDLTGELQASSAVAVDRGDRVAQVGYDHPAAVVQHEALSYAHDDGQAKYLEQPFNTEQDKMLDLIGDGVRRALDR